MKKLFLVCLVLAFVVGCVSYVPPTDRLVIHGNYLNAAQFNVVVQKDANVPEYVKLWMCEEDKTWLALDQWAKGKGSLAPPDPNAPK